MRPSIEAPTPQALADLVARCEQINRYMSQLTAAEEARIAALAAGIVAMRQVLALEPVAADKLPARQGRIQHWALTGSHLDEAATPAIRKLRGVLVVDEHEQIKVLSDRTWRGVWGTIKVWRDGVHDLSSAQLMEYLARLTALAHQRAPDVARGLLERAEAIAATHSHTPAHPRYRTG